MTDTHTLLVEIGTEELPPKALLRLSEAFTDGICQGLETAGLGYGTVTPYASPRRLAVQIDTLQTRQADREETRRGPALTAAFGEDGCPTKAAEGFARSCGVSVEELERLETDKGAWLSYTLQQPGQSTNALVPDIVRHALDKLPIPKRMRWGAGEAEFVRPVHWIVLMFEDKVIDTEILGVKSGNTTYGHRFHHPVAMSLFEADAYAPLLESQGHVIADFAVRREAVRAQVEEIAINHGGKAIIDAELLDEVTAMVEWPVAVLGNFDKRFLDVPAECLISSMKGHQKYFHMLDAGGALMPHFITVSNIESKDIDKVREGNERVIRPRLTDAEFFWQQDRKHALADSLDKLRDVIFQKQLGSLHDKASRISALSGSIAATLDSDRKAAQRAGLLAKCDLHCEMVYEFPELQGIMGRYYAQHDGEGDVVAHAIEQHYWPRFAGDNLPEHAVAQSVALADKLDTLVGIFGIGQPPSGDKDPFALRRAALGVLRILLELDLDLDVHDLIEQAATAYQQAGVTLADSTVEDVFDFILDRLPVYYANQDFAHDVIDSVISLRPRRLNDLDHRLRAVA
ncbi:MAG: glycine--tRNA ligase subunit beta, partial [Granulosicoccaceae bacterium]